MIRKFSFLMVLVLGLSTAVACGSNDEPDAGLANPASEYCVDNGGTLELRTDDAGGQYGVCIFDDGSECEEWAYFNDECQPGQYDVAPVPTAES